MVIFVTIVCCWTLCRVVYLLLAGCTETPQELQQVLQELSDESRRMGDWMNIAKTNVMVVDNTPINVNKVLIENVQGYMYKEDETKATRKQSKLD